MILLGFEQSIATVKFCLCNCEVNQPVKGAN
jgi:hypothetical protein